MVTVSDRRPYEIGEGGVGTIRPSYIGATPEIASIDLVALQGEEAVLWLRFAGSVIGLTSASLHALGCGFLQIAIS
jgi:hypothetical protein